MEFRFFLLFTTSSVLFLQIVQGACPIGQVFDPVSSTCVDNCLTSYYVITKGINKVCTPQALVQNLLRPTVQPFTFIVIFSEVNFTICENIPDIFEILTFSLNFGTSSHPIVNESILLNFLDTDKTLLEVTLVYQTWMTYPATLIIDFKDTTSDQVTNFYFRNPKLSISLLPFEPMTANQQNFANALPTIDFAFEIAWTSISLLNYYPVLYLQGKLYRETFNLYKMNGIIYSSITLDFFRRSSSKIAGIKVPNVFNIFLYQKDYSSGWNLDQNKRILLEENSQRDNLKIILNRRYHEFNSSPLFLENVGSEIILFAGILVAIIITEILAFLFFNDEESETLFYTIFIGLRVLLRWNFLLATLIGALPSVMYYAMAQIQAFIIYGTLGNNLAGSIVAIVVVVALGIIFPLVILEKIRLTFRIKEKTIEIISYNEVLTLDFFGILHEYYKADNYFYPMFIFIPMLRSVATAIISLFLTNSPIIQAVIMLIMSIIILAILIKFKPYLKTDYNVMQIVLEIINLLITVIITILAATQNAIDSGFIQSLNVILILLWIFTPLWIFGFGLYNIIMKIYRSCRRQKAPTTFRQRKISVRASIRASVRIHPIKILPGTTIQLGRHPRFMKQKTFDASQLGDNSSVSARNTIDCLSPTRSPTRWQSESPTQRSAINLLPSPERSSIKSKTNVLPQSRSRALLRSNTTVPSSIIEEPQSKQINKLPPGVPIQLAALKAAEEQNNRSPIEKLEEDNELFDLNSRRNLLP